MSVPQNFKSQGPGPQPLGPYGEQGATAAGECGIVVDVSNPEDPAKSGTIMDGAWLLLQSSSASS